MKKVAILYSEYTPLIDAIKYQLTDYDVECLTSASGMDNYDMVVNCGAEYDGEALACHYSLLPAFNSNEPVKDAVLAGVKVTGITIYYQKSKKIIAQYPVFINNETHYDNLRQELMYIEQTLFPLVIKKVLNNELFEVHALLNKSCNGACGGSIAGCGGCSH